MAIITPEIEHADVIFERELAVAVPLKMATGANAVAVESVIYTHESLSPASDVWFDMGISPNPDWLRSTTGISGHNVPLIARWYVSNYHFGSVTVAYQNWYLTKQLFLHGLILPTSLAIVHMTDSANSDINDMVTAEVFYHEVYLGRDELVALNNKYGKYRRTS